ncbi:MAG: (d)CMP kinase [Alphaproteobacteria bacterium]|nr:(d)CMP kinase [Alphaproteobacteria bacterium]
MTIVAIDGGAATGKGTLAKRLAESYGFAYLDTGALYRAVAYAVIQKGFEPDNEVEALKAARELPPTEMAKLQYNPVIRDEKYGIGASKCSGFTSVRQALFDFQRRFAENPRHPDGKTADGVVMDGRDIGTVICPDADLKVFLTARAEIRAQRRLKELQLRKIYAIYEDVLSDVIARDKRDSERKSAAMKPAEDAFVLDTSDLTPDEVFATVAGELDKVCGK